MTRDIGYYLKAAGLALGITLMGGGAYMALNQNATLEQRARNADLLKEATDDPKRRQEYLNTIPRPEHVRSIEYVDDKVQEMFRGQGLQIPKGSHIMVMPVDEDNSQVPLQHWHGKKSKVYVFETQFPDYSTLPIESQITRKQFYEGRDHILKARVEHNAQFQAKMMSEGIPNFHLDSFKDKEGRFNNQLYSATIILLSDLNEFSYHLAKKEMASNPLVEHNLLSLENVIVASYFHITNSLGRMNMDPKFAQEYIKRMHPGNALRK